MMGLPKPTRSSGMSREFKKLNFLKLSEGQHTIRMLQPLEDVHLVYTHWVKGTSIECPGRDTCPICINNQQILADNNNDWKAAKLVKGFNPWQVRYYANILDRTLVKVHPESESKFENKRDARGEWPITDADTGKPLADVEPQPSNTVKILAGGKTLFESLEAVEMATSIEEDAEGNPIPLGVDNYDVVLMVSGQNRERQITPVPQPTHNDAVTVEASNFHNLYRAVINLEPEEITDLVNGIALRDIFAARKSEQEEEPASVTVSDDEIQATDKLEEEVSDAIDSAVDAIFGKDKEGENNDSNS